MSRRDTHRLDAKLQKPRAQGGLELVGEVLVPQAQFPVPAVSKGVQQTAIFIRHTRRRSGRRQVKPVALAAAFTRDDG